MGNTDSALSDPTRDYVRTDQAYSSPQDLAARRRTLGVLVDDLDHTDTEEQTDAFSSRRRDPVASSSAPQPSASTPTSPTSATMTTSMTNTTALANTIAVSTDTSEHADLLSALRALEGAAEERTGSEQSRDDHYHQHQNRSHSHSRHEFGSDSEDSDSEESEAANRMIAQLQDAIGGPSELTMLGNSRQVLAAIIHRKTAVLAPFRLHPASLTLLAYSALDEEEVLSSDGEQNPLYGVRSAAGDENSNGNSNQLSRLHSEEFSSQQKQKQQQPLVLLTEPATSESTSTLSAKSASSSSAATSSSSSSASSSSFASSISASTTNTLHTDLSTTGEQKWEGDRIRFTYDATTNTTLHVYMGVVEHIEKRSSCVSFHARDSKDLALVGADDVLQMELHMDESSISAHEGLKFPVSTSANAKAFELIPGFKHPFLTPATEPLHLAQYRKKMLEACPEENYYPLVFKLETPVSLKDDPVVSAQYVYCDFVPSPDNESIFEIRHLFTRIQYKGKLYTMEDIYGCELPIDEDEIGHECVICICDPPNTLVLPCRHLCLCEDCANNFRGQSDRCPICRTQILSMILIKSKSVVSQSTSDDGAPNTQKLGKQQSGPSSPAQSQPPAHSAVSLQPRSHSPPPLAAASVSSADRLLDQLNSDDEETEFGAPFSGHLL